MHDINVFAVIVAAASSFVLRALWYATPAFGALWEREIGRDGRKPGGHDPAIVFGSAFVLAFIAALVFALFLGPKPTVDFAVKAGFATGLFWVATSVGINYLFAGRSLRLFLVDGGYHTAQFTLFGLILGLWH